ncbi:MAG: hypothetical protein ACE366_10525 [Bradymonadia bacterium]
MIRKVPEYLYDIRLVKRHVEMGVVTADEHKDWLANLEDAEGNSEAVVIEMESLKEKVGSKEVHQVPGDETTSM